MVLTYSALLSNKSVIHFLRSRFVVSDVFFGTDSSKTGFLCYTKHPSWQGNLVHLCIITIIYKPSVHVLTWHHTTPFSSGRRMSINRNIKMFWKVRRKGFVPTKYCSDTPKAHGLNWIRDWFRSASRSLLTWLEDKRGNTSWKNKTPFPILCERIEVLWIIVQCLWNMYSSWFISIAIIFFFSLLGKTNKPNDLSAKHGTVKG